MEAVKVGILEPDHFSNKAIQLLERQFCIEKYDGITNIDNFIRDKEVLFVRLNYKIDKNFVKHAKRLKYICTPTTGLNHIADDITIPIICLKGETGFLNTIRATPEHSFGLAMSLLRNYKFAFLNRKNKNWNRDVYRGYELYHSPIGIIGLGRVGKLLAQYYNVFGSNVYYYDTKEIFDSANAKKCVSIEELIHQSEIIHLCVNYTEEYKEFFNAKYFNLMRNKYFINTARGELVNERDLLQYIRSGQFKGIALDVLANETGTLTCLEELLDLAEHKNIIVTPHIAGATYSSMMRTEEFIAEKFLRAYNHQISL
jgi:D-3-phosphoglycerate dehydrogenase